MNGCRIGAADGSYQKELLEKWLDSNQIQAEVVVCKGYDEMIEKLDADELDALVVPALSVTAILLPLLISVQVTAISVYQNPDRIC